jgi:cell division protein FtsB
VFEGMVRLHKQFEEMQREVAELKEDNNVLVEEITKMKKDGFILI